MAEIYMQSKNNNSGNITLTNDYFVIKGKHYIFRDWYIKKSIENVAIPTNDINSMDFITFRYKGLLMIFVVLATILMMFGRTLSRLNSDIHHILILACVMTLGAYFCYVRKLFRVTAKGITVAVSVGNYNKNHINNLISYYYKTCIR